MAYNYDPVEELCDILKQIGCVKCNGLAKEKLRTRACAINLTETDGQETYTIIDRCDHEPCPTCGFKFNYAKLRPPMMVKYLVEHETVPDILKTFLYCTHCEPDHVSYDDEFKMYLQSVLDGETAEHCDDSVPDFLFCGTCGYCMDDCIDTEPED